MRTKNEEQYPVRILIDQGSELSFIREDLVQRVQLHRSAASIPLLGIGGTYSGRTKGSVEIQLQSIHDKTSSCLIRAFILSHLTTKLPPFNVSSPSWPHISGLQLADPDFSFTGPIHIIIGSDNYHAVIRPGLIPGDSSSPTAQQTIFGWVLCGPTSADDTPLSAQVYHCSPDLELQDLITRFWTQEELPNTIKTTLNEEEEECEKHFLTTHSRDTTGRYVVRLPLKANPSALGESKSKALGCLKRLFLQFSSKNTFQKLYVDFIDEYKHMGHMVEADRSSDQTSYEHYLPHHGVLRESSRTTKLRVVFNGSSRTSNGLSLNDILHAGAKLQTDICEILLWTRTHKVLFSIDIVKMFRQIAVHPDDWDLQRILWIGQDNQPIAYRLTTVTYGLTCAPFLALRTLQQLVKDEGHRFSKAIVPMTKGRYVDDIFGGADSTSEAKDIIHQLIQLCESGRFPLQKWSSNRPEILPQSNKETFSDVEIEPALYKILGLVWRPCSDTLHFSSTIPATSTITKRAIASDIAKLYDPLGLISPILIRAKIILQELWLLKIGWDEPLPTEIRERWITFRQQLLQIEQVSIPRWFGVLRSNTSTIEIHGFSDASQLTMAAAVYIRIPGDEDKGSVQLICSKTRVAPLKRLTIPRLELNAALLLARLIAKTTEALELHEATVICWSDSMVTLTWIRAHPSRWKDFVRNRVSALQEILPNGSWRYVPGKENPADLASRGLTPDQLIHHNLWWNGPKWLSESQTSWPSNEHRPAPDLNLEERPGHAMWPLVNLPTGSF